MTLQEKMNELTPEQREKAKACKTPEEVLEFAKKEGYELSIDELDVVSGGGWSAAKCLDKCTNAYVT